MTMQTAVDWKAYINISVLAPLWREPVLRRASLAATLLMAVVLAYSAARLTWLLIPEPQGGMEGPLAAGLTPVPVAAMLANQAQWGREIRDRHLFGLAAGGDLALNPATMPESNLQLILKGVLASQDSRIARAIIADPGGKDQYYAIGAMLPGGAVLKEIHDEQVVLARNGRLETLRLPKTTTEGPGTVPRMTGAMPPNMYQGGGMPAPMPPPSRLAPGGGPGVPPGASLRQYRDAFVRNPAEFGTLLQIDPVQEGNQTQGFRVMPGRDPLLLARLGLLPGDVVVAVNGQSLADPAARLEVMRQLSARDQLNIEVLRNGARQFYSLRLD